jgi:ABC-type transport system involved in multi-copper enzyme maturation permease subunit
MLAVAANTYRETVRERVLYVLVVFAVLMTLSGLLLGELSIRQDEKIVKDIGLASMDVFGTLIAIFVGVGLVSKEIERRSLYPLLAKPLGRGEFLLGKLAGLSFTLLVNVGFMAAGMFLTLLVTHRTADPGLLKAVYAIYLGLLLTVAIALFFSVVASSSILASVWTLSLVIAGRYSDVILHMRQVTDAPAWLVQGLYLVLPNFRNFDFKDRVVYGEAVSALQLGSVTLYALVYIAVLLGAANLAFRSRDLT